MFLVSNMFLVLVLATLNTKSRQKKIQSLIVETAAKAIIDVSCDTKAKSSNFFCRRQCCVVVNSIAEH